MIGTVKKLVTEKGFGFITTSSGDFFFHRSECQDFDTLQEGQSKVSFDVEDAPSRQGKGPRAKNVRVEG